MAYIVKQPASHGRIIIYLAESRHIPGKGARQIRTYLGSLDTKSNELILNAKAKEPNPEVLELLKAKGIAYGNRKADGPGRKHTRKASPSMQKQLMSDLEKSDVFEVGRVNCFNFLATESGLLSCLEKTFGDISKRILSAAIYQASEAMPLYLAGEWASDIGNQDGMSSSTLSRMIDALGSDSALLSTFFTHWIEACGKPTSVIHDTTSLSSYSDSIDEVEWGYNRDGESLPQVNMALVVAKDSNLPIWFRMISGSIPDVASLKLTCTILKSLGLKQFSFSLDRGYFSRTNLIEMIENKIGFTIGVPTTQTQATNLILAHKALLESTESSFLYNGKRMRHTTCEYQITNHDKSLTKLSGHLFLDLERRESITGRMETTILELDKLGSNQEFKTRLEAEAWITEKARKLTHYFKIMGNENKWIISRDTDAITQAISTAGVALILSSKNSLKAEEVLDDYRCRDIAENVFDTVKNGIGLHRLRTSSSTQANGRLFLAFIAVILRALIESKLKKSNLLSKYSVDESLAILKKIKQIKLLDGTVVNLEIPKKARIIQEAIESKVPKVEAPK